MKKFVTLILISLCIFFNTFALNTFASPQGNLLKEGIYDVSDLELAEDKLYAIQNTSNTDNAFVLLFDDHTNLVQFIKLMPGSSKQNLLPMKAHYRIIVVGTTQVFIS